MNFTPTVLLHWFLDDGYSYIVNRKYKNPKWNKRKVRVLFSTQSFQKEELELLAKKILDNLGLKVYVRFHRRNGKVLGTGYELELSEKKSNITLFYDIIGPPPVPSLAYKWK